MNSSLLSSLLYGLVSIVLLSTMTAMGVFEGANLAMVDRLFHTLPNQQPTPPILLVSTTESDRNRPGGLRDLVVALQEYGPESIYLLDYEPQPGQQNMATGPAVTQVVSTSRLRYASPAHLPDLIPGEREFMTSVSLKGGHYRLWNIAEQVHSREYIGFQARANPSGVTHGSVIDFSMEDGFLPVVRASRVIEEGLTSVLIRDKIILIGDALEPGLPGFTVPLRPESGISQLELQGYVLHSALSSRLLNFVGIFGTIIGVVILGAMSSVVFQWLPSHSSAILALGNCLFIVAVQWGTVKYVATIIPAWELIIAQLANLLAVYQLQRNREEQALNRIIAKTNSRLSERVQPVNFNRSDDPWKKILSLVNQQLNIKRSIFLEKVPADHRVKEIEALNCSLDDVSERRRDYEREPYSSALKANAPIEPFRDYFTEVESSEIQYIVPLCFGGEVLGFWALSLLPAKSWNRVAFENNVRSFAIQIAELLYHRQHWHTRRQKSESAWRKLLSVQAGLSLHRELNNTVDLLEHRLDILEDVLNSLSTAVVVYDVFGQVLHTNSSIEHLAQENDVAVYNLTAMELLARSNDVSLDEARNKLRYVTLKHQTLVQSSTLFSSRGSYLLYIRPLLLRQESSMEQISPFEVRGILFEFADLTQVQQHDEIRQDLADQYFDQIRSNLASINFAVDDLNRHEQINPAQRLGTISDKVHESTQLTDRVEEELRNQIHMREQTVPTNIPPIIGRLITKAEDDALARELSFDYELPASNSLNFVEPKTFEQLISALLKLLINDAIHGTPIKVAIGDSDRAYLHVRLTNSGHGMPREQLEQTLSTYQSYLDMNEDPLTQVSVLTQQVLLWGGEVSFQTGIGTGFAIDIKLKTFNLSLPATP